MDGPGQPSSNAPAQPRRPTTFLDALRQVDVRALDTLYDHLKDDRRWLGAARLACRGLRQAIDGSVRAADIWARTILARAWNPAHTPPLARFPRCTSLTISLEADEDEDEDNVPEPHELVEIMSLPLVGVDQEARRRITSLALHTVLWAVEGYKPPAIDVVVPALTSRLPWLQTLNLGKADQVWPSRMRQVALYQHLAASLPHLEVLVLPSYAAVAGVEALRGQLKDLAIGQVDMDEGPNHTLTRSAVATITQLTRLTRLNLHGYKDGADAAADAATALALLDTLQPSVEDLCLVYLSGYISPSVGSMPFETKLQLKAGRIQDVTMEHSETLAGMDVLASLLLASSRLPCKLGLLRCAELTNKNWDGTDTYQKLLGPFQPLQRLLARCARVEVDKVDVGGDEATQTVLEVVRLFGLPEYLSFGHCSVRLRKARTGGEAAKLGAAEELSTAGAPVELQDDEGAAVVASLPPTRLASVTAAELLRTVMEHLWGLSAPPAVSSSAVEEVRGGSSNSSSNGGGSIAVSDTVGASSGGGGGARRCFVVLRGTFFSVLGMDDRKLLHDWIQSLRKRAKKAESCGGAGVAGEGGGTVEGSVAALDKGELFASSWTAVPAADAVVVELRTMAAVTALAAAAVRVGAGAGGSLEAAVLSWQAGPWRRSLGCTFWEYDTPWFVVNRTTEQLVQELWDAAAGSSGLSEAERLSCLTRLLAEVAAVSSPYW